MKKAKTVFWTLISLYALGIIAWPFLSFGAIFAFDDPNANPILTYYIAFSIWLYPAFVFAGYRLGHPSKNQSLRAIILKTSVPLLSALVYMAPIFGGSIAWSALRMESQAEYEERRTDLKSKLDPIYIKRMENIQKRSPIGDAEKAIEMGHIAFLPSRPHGNLCPLMDGQPFEVKDPGSNYKVILDSPFLNEIEFILGIDPEHNFPSDDYFSEIFKKHGETGWSYRERFNRVIHDHVFSKNENI